MCLQFLVCVAFIYLLNRLYHRGHGYSFDGLFLLYDNYDEIRQAFDYDLDRYHDVRHADCCIVYVGWHRMDIDSRSFGPYQSFHVNDLWPIDAVW